MGEKNIIGMNDFQSEPAALRKAMLDAVQRVFDSGWYILGKEAEKFERVWAQTCKTAHGVGVGNGLDAIELALRALGIGPGDEVITTAMTAFATVLAIFRAGATPVLADIEPGTALLSIESVKRCLSPRTKAVLLVHLYGQVRDMQDWLAFCKSNGVIIIEDCAQAHLAQWRGRFAGSFGRIGAYSFYPTKNLGALGDAGMVVTDEDALAEKVCRLRNYGQSERYHHPELGANSRLDEMQAALLCERLKWLPEFTRRRQAIAESYFRGISNPRITLPARPAEGPSHVFHLFVVLCSTRDRLSAYLKERGIVSLIHYPIPIHHQPPCRDVRRDPQGLACAESYAKCCLSIPCHPQMTDADVDCVIKTINEYR